MFALRFSFPSQLLRFKAKDRRKILLLFELSLSRSSPYIFVHIRRSTSAIEVYLGSALLFSIFARFMYPLLIQLEKMETFSCTKFLNRLFRPLRDEMLASRWSIASSSATGLLLARLSHFYGRFHSCQLHFQTALIFTHFPKKKLLYVIFCIMQTNLMRFQHRAADFIPFQCIFVCIHYITLVIWEMYLSILRLPFLVLRGIRRTWGVL